MKYISRLLAVVIVLSVLLTSVNAEDTFDMFLNITLDLETMETSITETEITGENDFSKLSVTVIEVMPDRTEREVYKGLLGGYDNGRWVNVDFSDNKPFAIFDWQTQSTFWVIPSENSVEETAVEIQNDDTETDVDIQNDDTENVMEIQNNVEEMTDIFTVKGEKEFSLPEMDDSFESVEYEDEVSEYIPQDTQLYLNYQSQNTDEPELAVYSNNNFVFNASLLSSFNTVTGPIAENGANEPKFSYNEFLEENISDYSGELTLNFEDIVLEGRNGLDLRIGRTYQSVAADVGQDILMILPDESGYLRNRLVADYSNYLSDRYNLGVGWGFSFPSVQVETEYVPQEVEDTFYYDEEQELYYHSGNGEVYQVQFTSDTTDSNLKGYYEKDIQFNRNDTGYNNGQVVSYYSMTLSDRTKQYFAEDGRLIGIVDRFGNTIKFEHELYRITNRVPDGEFVYDDNMWTSSKTSSSKDAIHSESKGQFDLTSMKFRQNNADETYIISQPIQVKPETTYEIGLSVYSKYGDDIQIEVIGYDTLYNYDHSEIFTISDYPTNEWYEFSDTFSMSSATRYIEIKISPENARDTYIDNVYLDEPKPLISKITDSVGRTIKFAYAGSLIEGTTGAVNVVITSPDKADTRTLTYNKGIIKFTTEYQKHDEQRKHWYLTSSNTEGDDGTVVRYEYKGGTTTDSEGNTIYPRLYINYSSKTQSTADTWNNKPVLSSVRYKDRKKIYEYETVRKNLGEDGYYDTLRVNKTYDMYSYVPEGATKISFKGELDAVDYSYEGSYNGNTFDNETGYPNYSFDDETNLNEQWTVTKTGKSTDTVTFSNSAVVQQTSCSDGTTIVSDYTNHEIFKNSPTQIKITTAQNDTEKETYILYSYNDWGGVESATKEIDDSIKNNAGLLEKYTTTYEYNDFHDITEKRYYSDINSPQVREVNTFDSNGLLTSSENAVKEKVNYYYENSDYTYLITKSVIDDPMMFHNLMGGDRVINYAYDEYGLYPVIISETYDGGTAETSYIYDYITGDLLTEIFPDESYKDYIYYSDGRINLEVSPYSVDEDDRLFYTIDRHIYGLNYALSGYDEEELRIFNREEIVKYICYDDEEAHMPYQSDVNFYDAAGNLVANLKYYFQENGTAKVFVASTVYYYDEYDRLCKTIDSEGNTIEYAYDGFDRLVTITDSENNVYTYVYDDVQNKVDLTLNGATETTDRKIATQYFDLYGNVVQNTVYPNNSIDVLTETYEYDLNDNLISFTNANGNETEYVYDAGNRMKETVLSNGVKATANYSVFNEPTFEKVYASDGTEKLARVTYQNEKGDRTMRFINYDNRLVDTYNYSSDAKGRMTSISEGENTKTLIYDEFDRSLISVSGESQIQRRYDKFGEAAATSMDNDIADISYGYDNVGNLNKKIQDGVHSMFYTYSPLGNITQSTMPSGRTESYTYTPNGNLNTIVSDGKTFDYDYYDTGLVKSINYPNGLKTEYEYDNINRVTGMTTTKGNTVVNSFGYEYDNNGNMTKEIRSGEVTEYSYDSLDRLISVTYSDGSSVAYEYDALNNRTREIYSNGDAKDYIYDESNRLSEVKLNGETTDTYTYNKTGAVVTHNDKTYTYNEWDKLSGYSDGTNSYTYKYDANGIRTQKNDKQYIIDINNNVVAETDSAGAIIDEILWGHQPLARIVNGSWYYYIYNAHGDVVGLVNESGTVVNTYEYTPWGEIRNETETVDNPIKYAGEYYDDKLGMIYLRARYYNPQIGRFTSLDIEEGEISNPLDMNRYVYCRNNPIKYIDPSGGEPITLTVGTVAIIKFAIGAILAIGATYTLNNLVKNISDNRKHHILHGSNNSHESGWRKFNIDPNDPKGFEKLLPIINEVIKNGTKSEWKKVDGGRYIRTIEYYFTKVGETVRVIINKTAEGIETITDAYTKYK